jgi:RNA polymerase sigma-70 factor (ECF subfamily)
MEGVSTAARGASGEEARRALEERIGRLLDEGDRRGAASEAVRGYGHPVLVYLMKLLGDTDAAQEVFGRTTEKLWRGIGQYRRECSVRTWFYKLAWNAAADYRKEARHRRERRLQTNELARAEAEVRHSTQRYLRTEARERLARLREGLDPEDRSLLVLRVERRLSFREVAEVMSDPDRPLDEQALRKRYERLKDRLRRLATELESD